MLTKKLIRFFQTKIGSILLVTLTFLFLFILQMNDLGLTLRTKIPLGATLDFSWFSDAVERIIHGYLLGRDFTFTYGPLFQIIYSLPSLLFHFPSYISVALSPLISFIVVFLLVLIIAKQLTKNIFEQVAYILFLFVVLGLLVLNTGAIRVLMPISYALLLYNLFQKKASWFHYYLIAFIPTLFGLFSYSLFVICLFYTIALIIILFFRNNKLKRNRSFILFIPALIILHLFFSYLITPDLSYLKDSLDALSNYKNLMYLTWTPDRSNIMLLFPFALLFLGAYLLKTKNVVTELKNKLLILILISFIGFLSAISRSDAGHLQLGVYPSLLTLFTIIFFLSKKIRWLLIIAFLFYLIVPNKPTFYNTFAPKNILKVVELITHNPSFFEIYQLPQDYYYTKNEIQDMSKLINDNKGKVFFYPYDSFLLNSQNTTFNSYALGIYTYSNSLVEKKTIQGFQKNPPAFIVLGIDTKGALNLDDIPNFTRNPLVAEWMIKHYRVKEQKTKYLVLEFDPKKQSQKDTNSCQIHELKINLIKKENIIQKIIGKIKLPVYYLGDIRLPYSPSTNTYFIFDGIYSVNGVAALFNSGANYKETNAHLSKAGQLEITRISPFLRKKEQVIFTKDEYSLRCVAW
jgi:hypothetical protein